MKNNLPLREIAYTKLKNQILSGQLSPGVRIVETALATELNASRTVIREAIQQLQFEGLVDIIPYKGAIVATLSLKDIEELYVIRGALEGLAAALTVQKLKKDEISEFRRIHSRLNKSIDGDPEEWLKINSEFHHFFIDRCGNSRLQNSIRIYREKFPQYWNILLAIPEQRQKNMTDHEKILKALESGNALEVRLAMENHFSHFSKNLINFLKKNTFMVTNYI